MEDKSVMTGYACLRKAQQRMKIKGEQKND